jgi:hypothetical protein
MDQALQRAGRQRIAPKTSNIPPPHEQVAQTRAEGVVELGWSCVRAETLNLRPHAPFLDAVTSSANSDASFRGAGQRRQVYAACASLAACAREPE